MAGPPYIVTCQQRGLYGLSSLYSVLLLLLPGRVYGRGHSASAVLSGLVINFTLADMLRKIFISTASLLFSPQLKSINRIYFIASFFLIYLIERAISHISWQYRYYLGAILCPPLNVHCFLNGLCIF